MPSMRSLNMRKKGLKTSKAAWISAQAALGDYKIVDAVTAMVDISAVTS